MNYFNFPPKNSLATGNFYPLNEPSQKFSKKYNSFDVSIVLEIPFLEFRVLLCRVKSYLQSVPSKCLMSMKWRAKETKKITSEKISDLPGSSVNKVEDNDTDPYWQLPNFWAKYDEKQAEDTCFGGGRCRFWDFWLTAAGERDSTKLWLPVFFMIIFER